MALLGAVIGFLVPTSHGPTYASSATVVFTAVQLDNRPSTPSEARAVAVRIPTWARVAASGDVAASAGLGTGESIAAREISGVNALVVTLTSPTRPGLADRATAAARTVIAEVTRGETPGGASVSRVSGLVASPGSAPSDVAEGWAWWGAALGLVIGALLGALVSALVRRGESEGVRANGPFTRVGLGFSELRRGVGSFRVESCARGGGIGRVGLGGLLRFRGVRGVLRVLGILGWLRRIAAVGGRVRPGEGSRPGLGDGRPLGLGDGPWPGDGLGSGEGARPGPGGGSPLGLGDEPGPGEGSRSGSGDGLGSGEEARPGWGDGPGSGDGSRLGWGDGLRPGSGQQQPSVEGGYLGGDPGARHLGADQFASNVDVELRELFRSRRALVGMLVAAVGVGGYAATGSVWPPFLATVVAAVAARRDPRWIALAILGLGVTVLPDKLDLVKIGPITPTVLEVAVVVGVVATWGRENWGRGIWGRGDRGCGNGGCGDLGRGERSVFTGPLVGVAVAVVVGCLWGLARGGDFSVVADAARAILLVPLVFVVVGRAFSGRLPQLVALTVVGASVASAVEVVASVVGAQRLLVDERTSVITGTDTSEVSRLAAPILPLWGPLLILLVSGAFPVRPRWRLVLLAVPGVVHEALSFNRSTWAPLLGFAVVVAVARFGTRGVVKRLIAAVLLGTLALGLAGVGAFGSTGEALAGRVTSVITGNALAEDSLADRQRENVAALETLRRHPVMGTGVGVPYGGEIVSYDNLHDRTEVEARPWIHNQYLRMWLWFGVFGLLMVGLLMVRVAVVVVRSWHAPAAVLVLALGLGLACLALQSVMQTTLIDRPTLVVVGLVLAMMAQAVRWRPLLVAVPVPLRTGR